MPGLTPGRPRSPVPCTPPSRPLRPSKNCAVSDHPPMCESTAAGSRRWRAGEGQWVGGGGFLRTTGDICSGGLFFIAISRRHIGKTSTGANPCTAYHPTLTRTDTWTTCDATKLRTVGNEQKKKKKSAVLHLPREEGGESRQNKITSKPPSAVFLFLGAPPKLYQSCDDVTVVIGDALSCQTPTTSGLQTQSVSCNTTTAVNPRTWYK